MGYKPPKDSLRSLLSRAKPEINYRGGPFDTKNPRSLINIAPEEVVHMLMYKMTVDLLYMNELQLEEKFRPSSEIQKIRLAFWKEYETAQSELRKMTIANIGRFMGQPSASLLKVIRNVNHLAVILCPIASYENFLEEALMAGTKRLREMINLPFYKPDGELDHKTMDLILKAVAFIDLRKNGGIVQRQVQVNVDKKTAREIGSMPSSTSLEDIDKRIAELEASEVLKRNGGIDDGEVESSYDLEVAGTRIEGGEGEV